MTGRVFGIFAAVALAAAQVASQNNEAPPAIAQWGITNFASRIQPGLAGGSIARGSLVRIRGWRLGPSSRIEVLAVTAGKRWSLTPLANGDNEIEARVPADAPLGSANVHVVRNGQASLEWPVTVTEASFGAFSRNGSGWGPGQITNADGAANSEEHPAHPGETIRLLGTGLGAEPLRTPRVLLAGTPVANVSARHEGSKPGVDELVIELPLSAPSGCYVPVVIVSAPGVYSNAVTLAISNGGPCGTGANALASAARTPGGSALLLLAHADIALELSPKFTGEYPMDAVYASFLSAQAGEAENPVFLSPPPGACTSFNGPTRTLSSPAAVLNMFPGGVLDAGHVITVEGASGVRTIPMESPAARHFFAVIGGHPLSPVAKELPRFLVPGDEYAIKTGGGVDVPSFQVSIRAADPVIWTNRAALADVDRARGATVEWKASPRDALVAILAMNSDSLSGNMGGCICLANAAAGSFHVPAYALANIPRSPAHARGFPLNLMFVLAFPQLSTDSAGIRGLSRSTKFAASISGRSVRFR